MEKELKRNFNQPNQPLIDNRALNKVTEVVFSAKVDPRIEVARRVAKELGFSEEELLKKYGRKAILYSAFPPAMGIRLRKEFIDRLRGKRGRRRNKGR